jgi:hypothetical protein
MSWEKKGLEGLLHHPDGSPNIAAYSKIAHRKRQVAIAAAVRETARSLRAVPSAIRRVLGRPGPIRLNTPLRG